VAVVVEEEVVVVVVAVAHQEEEVADVLVDLPTLVVQRVLALDPHDRTVVADTMEAAQWYHIELETVHQRALLLAP